MDYDRIILELLDRVMKLEEELKAIKKVNPVLVTMSQTESHKSRIYKSFSQTLMAMGLHLNTFQYTISDIERTLGFRLPDEARTDPNFWGNDANHPLALCWRYADLKAKVNLDAGVVIFEKQ